MRAWLIFQAKTFLPLFPFFMKTTIFVFLLSVLFGPSFQEVNAQSALAENTKSFLAAVDVTDEEKTNLAAARKYVMEYLAYGDVSAADQTADPNLVVVTGLSPKEPIRGLANHKKIFLQFVESLPTTSMVIEDIFAAKDRVVIRFNCLAQFKKDYIGVKATNKPLRLIETHVMTFKNGKMIEDVVSATNLEFEMTFAPVLIPAVLGNK